MALDDEVKARWSSQILINASNPQASTSTTIDQTRLTIAENDVQAMFEVLAGVVYNNAVNTHVLYATEGVLVRLLVLTGQAPNDQWDAWKKSMKEELALVTGRDRIVPYTNSTLSPTAERANSRPAADRSVFERQFIPRSPGGGQDRSLPGS